ncbi:MAG TPA: cytochrome c biogenesis protein ResB, partial [Armatimonadota bacterium]|nr:cytochrome c biogenesis protein ResB [Armatimonadota bacterium]
RIGDSHVLMLRASRMPKRYQSFVTIAEDGKQPVETVIEVNKPARIGPWRLYQSSYDQDSAVPAYTVLQAVRDPALPIVYTGLVCMVLGAFIACWAPRRKPEERAEEAA